MTTKTKTKKDNKEACQNCNGRGSWGNGDGCKSADGFWGFGETYTVCHECKGKGRAVKRSIILARRQKRDSEQAKRERKQEILQRPGLITKQIEKNKQKQTSLRRQLKLAKIAAQRLK